MKDMLKSNLLMIHGEVFVMIPLINQMQMSSAEWLDIPMEQNLLGRAPEVQTVPTSILLVMGPETSCWMMYIAMAMKLPSFNVHIMDGATH